jgi:hypothetical protein
MDDYLFVSSENIAPSLFPSFCLKIRDNFAGNSDVERRISRFRRRQCDVLRGFVWSDEIDYIDSIGFQFLEFPV